MAQKYKVYFANRPVIFTTIEEVEKLRQSGDTVISSQGKMNTMHIESAIAAGAKAMFITCSEPENAWESFRHQFEFVQAAGGVVQNTRGEILFIYRLDKWDLPKGKVESGENLEEAAMREVEEECSIFGLKIIKKLDPTWHTYIQKGEPMLKATAWYLMEYQGNDTPAPQLIEGITEVAWIAPKNFKTVLKNTYPSVIDVIRPFMQG